MIEVESSRAAATRAAKSVMRDRSWLSLVRERCCSERWHCCCEGLAPLVDFGGAPVELVELDETGLVDVDEAAVLGGGGVGFALESGQLLVKDLVIGIGCGRLRACSPASRTSGRRSASRICS